MAFDTTAAASILRNLYLPPIKELLNNSTVLLKYLEKEVQDVEGKNFTVPIHTSRNQAAGVGVSESGTLPVAGQQAYTTATVPAKFLYSRINVSGPAIASTKSNKGSFLRALDAEMKGVTRDTRRAFNRQLHSDGRDVLGFWVSGATTSIIVDDSLGDPGSDFFNTGSQRVEFVDSDNTTINAGVGSTGAVAITGTRAALTSTGRTITVSSSVAANVAAAAGDYFIVEGTLGKQMTGIQAAISDGNPPLLAGGLHGLTVAANPDWIAQVYYADGGTSEPTGTSRVDMSFEGMQKPITAIAANSDFDESDIKLILGSFAARDTYVSLAQNERKFFNTMKLDGGFEAVTYNGKPIVPDVHCRRHRFYYIVPETMALFRLADLDWINLPVSTTVH